MVLFLFLMLLIYKLYPIYSQNVEGRTRLFTYKSLSGYSVMGCPRQISNKKIFFKPHCGQHIETIIMFLNVFPVSEFPHMAAILYEPIYVNDNTSYKCYGSLISEKFVLTPASCHFLPEKPIEVHLGVVSFTSTNVSNVQKLKIKKVTIHPMFTTKTYNDLALVELEEEVRFDQYVRPICLGDDLGWENETSVIAGWTYERSDLEKTSIDVRFDCQSSYGTHQYHLTERQLCAKIKLVSTLFVGSPIQIRSKDVNCMYTLVAFVTFEQIYEYPAFLATVKHYREWIESVIWPDETPSTTAIPQRYRPVR